MTKFITTGYSEGDKRFLATMKRALVWSEQHPNGMVRLGWNEDVYVKDIRRIFRGKIDRAINKRGKVHHCRGRKDCYEQHTAWMRDAITIRHYREHGFWSQFGKPLTKEGRRAIGWRDDDLLS